MSAAGIKKVRPSDAAEGQQLVGVMLHRKFKKERTASQRTQRLFRCDSVDEFLDAGKIRRVKKKRLLVRELLFLVEKALLNCVSCSAARYSLMQTPMAAVVFRWSKSEISGLSAVLVLDGKALR